jgi:hypothetical protein
MRPLFVFAVLVLAATAPCFAAGGTCPSGANYVSSANPTGSKVTLSSLGITSCYFVSAGGLDTNAGTTEGAAFLHSPGMQNCSNSCAAVTLAAGLGIIFRGGDTYHFGNSSLTPYAGVVSTCADNGNNAAGLCIDDIDGSSSHPIYYGVDPTWFTGGSWVRPILTADNPLCNSGTTGTLPDGATCTGTTDSFGQPSYHVSACGYQVGNTNNLVDVGFSEYIIVDSFEMTGLCQSHVGQPFGSDVFLQYEGDQGPTTFQNNYIHGATHLQYAAKNGSAGCTGSTVCTNLFAFQGSVIVGSVGETIVFNVVDFVDSDPGGSGLCFDGFYNVAYNVFRYTTQCIPNPLFTFHDNLYEYFFENGHSNVIESLDPGTTNAIYNNVFRHIENLLSSGGGVFLWLGPQTGSTDYIFNNIGYDLGGMELLNIGGDGVTNNTGNYVFFNNAWQTNVANTILSCQLQSTGSTTDTNNYYVDDETPYVSCPSLTKTTSLCQSNTSGGTSTACPLYSDANTTPHFDQYTGSETFAYSPVASTNSTVGAGTNERSAYCGALTTAGLTAAATACESDTTYGVSYAGSGAFPVYPARTANSRPSSGAWDIGVYEFSGAPLGSFMGKVFIGNGFVD